MHHEIKIEAQYFDQDKPFEIRFNDRGYQKGDTVTLNEIDAWPPWFTGRKKNGVITYVTNFQQKEGWVVFGLSFDPQIPPFPELFSENILRREEKINGAK